MVHVCSLVFVVINTVTVFLFQVSFDWTFALLSLLLLKLIYEYMQEKYIKLRLCLEYLPKEYHCYHEYFAKTISIPSLNKEAEAILWHQRLIHCRSHWLKSVLLFIGGVSILSAFNFDNVLKRPTCLKTNLTKNF